MTEAGYFDRCFIKQKSPRSVSKSKIQVFLFLKRRNFVFTKKQHGRSITKSRAGRQSSPSGLWSLVRFFPESDLLCHFMTCCLSFQEYLCTKRVGRYQYKYKTKKLLDYPPWRGHRLSYLRAGEGVQAADELPKAR
jgi:hypothetical protein